MVEEREVKISTTDNEIGYMFKDGIPEGLFYLDRTHCYEIQNTILLQMYT